VVDARGAAQEAKPAVRDVANPSVQLRCQASIKKCSRLSQGCS